MKQAANQEFEQMVCKFGKWCTEENNPIMLEGD
jgi:hypothetical protein